MSSHYVLDGKVAVPVEDVKVWAQFFERDNRTVATDTIRTPNRLLWALGLRPDYWVSTVFLGLDHRHGDGPPLIFETMVFRRWPWWKSKLAELKRPMRMGKTWEKTWDQHPYPPRRYLTFEWLGRKSVFVVPSFKRWYSRRYMGIHIFDWSEWSEQDCARCSTWEQAEAQHKKMLQKWTAIAKDSLDSFTADSDESWEPVAPESSAKEGTSDV